MENCPKYLCSQIGKAALRGTRHDGHESESDRQESANEGSINFSLRILFSGLVKLQDSTVKVKL